MVAYYPIQWVDGKLRLLDQRELPFEVEYVDYADYHQVADAIRVMVVRGAPAIGITAAYGMVLAAQQSQAGDVPTLLQDLQAASGVLAEARPTAVNLFWALNRIMKRAGDPALTSTAALREAVLDEAHAIYAFEKQSNYQIGVECAPAGAGWRQNHAPLQYRTAGNGGVRHRFARDHCRARGWQTCPRICG